MMKSLVDDWFSLAKAGGPTRKHHAANDRQDVVKVETLLGNTGILDWRKTKGAWGHHGALLDDGIKRFQKREGLKVDGLLNPGGPTITRLKDQLAPLMTPYKPPSPDEVDAHQGRIHGTSKTPGGQGLLTHVTRRPKLHPNSTLLPVAEPDRKANSLTLASLLNHTTDGDQPRWLAGDIAQRGQPAIAKVRALVQDADTAEPGRGEGLLRGILDHLPDTLHASFLGAPAPKKVPLGVRLAEAGPQDGEGFRMAVSDGESGGKKKEMAEASQPQTPVPDGESGKSPSPTDHADDFQLDPEKIAKAGTGASSALERLAAFRDADPEAKMGKAWQGAWQESIALGKENPELARDIQSQLLDYKTNPEWAPAMMSDDELQARRKGGKPKDLGNGLSVASGTLAGAGAALDVADQPLAAGALGKMAPGLSLPGGIAAGINQVQREGMKREDERRNELKLDDTSAQLGIVAKDVDLATPNAEQTMKKVLALRDTDDKRAALKDARAAAKALRDENPASTPELLSASDIKGLLDSGSDVDNAIDMGSAILDIGAAVVPRVFGPVGLGAGGVVAGVRGLDQWGRNKAAAELERRKKLKDNRKRLGRRPKE